MTVQSLHKEFVAWTAANGIADDAGDAEEILCTDGLTTEQREWLGAFITRWDDASDAQQWGAQ